VKSVAFEVTLKPLFTFNIVFGVRKNWPSTITDFSSCVHSWAPKKRNLAIRQARMLDAYDRRIGIVAFCHDTAAGKSAAEPTSKPFRTSFLNTSFP
jgi:hypothetical protein